MRSLSLSHTREEHYVRNTTRLTSFVQSNKIVHGKPAEIRLDYMQYIGVGEVADRVRQIHALVMSDSCCLLGLLFGPENGGSIFLQIVAVSLSDSMASPFH
jgi:hypothetical protein